MYYLKSRPARGGWIEIARYPSCGWKQHRPAPHGAGGLKSACGGGLVGSVRPAPHGAGGLKYVMNALNTGGFQSRPARGGWIEILVSSSSLVSVTGPAPHGAGGLK